MEGLLVGVGDDQVTGRVPRAATWSRPTTWLTPQRRADERNLGVRNCLAGLAEVY